jgi:hypothetical protein
VPASNDITVTEALAGTTSKPDWVSLTFNFNGWATVSANQTMDLIIQYVVTTPPLASITSVNMTGTAASRTQTTTTSRATLSGSLCLGGAYDVAGTAPDGACLGDGTDTVLNTALKGTTTNATDNPNLLANQTTRSASSGSLAESVVGVYDEVKLLGGSTDSPTAASQAAASTFTQTFNESYEPGYGLTPEPVPVVLVGCALVGLSWGRRQKPGR